MFALRSVKPRNLVRYVRKYSGHSEEEIISEISKWNKICAGALVLSAISTVYIIGTDEHAHPERPDLHKFTTKPFPWKCHDCSLMETACWNECKGVSSGSHHH